MQTFTSEGITIAFIDEGEGFPTLLIHGFGSNHRVNWVSTSWTRDLVGVGRRVIALDNRGHGESGKPHDASAYRTELMAEDARRLLDRLEIKKIDVMGYSMGARIAAFLALEHPQRVRRLVLSGIGEGLVKGLGDEERLAAALRAPSLDAVTGDRPRMFRAFAEQTKSDREALAACILGSRQVMTTEQLSRLAMPVLVAAGNEDEMAGSAAALARMIPDAEAFEIPGRDHMKAVGDRKHKQAVLGFLAGAGG